MTAILIPLLATAPPAHADIPATYNHTAVYTESITPMMPYTANPQAFNTDTVAQTAVNGQINGIIGNHYSRRGSGCWTITLTRKDCIFGFCNTIYQAHLTMCWQWNVDAFGGVVYNVTKLMWADHLLASITSDAPSFSEGHFTYNSVPYHIVSANGGYYVNGVMNVKQCFASCIQTETVVAYVHGHDDGSFVSDINHS